MRNFFKTFGIIALVAVMTFAMASCNNGTGGGSDNDPLPQTATYTGTANGSTYTLIITENTARYTAEIGDSYVLTVTSGGTTKTSSGTVTATGNTLTLTPSGTTATFTITITTTGGITAVTGKITFIDGTKSEEESVVVTPPSGSGGTFTVTGIPAEYNGKYAYFEGEVNDNDLPLVGFQSFNETTGVATLVQIANGSVSLPMWIWYDGDNEYVVKYSGNDTVEGDFKIFNSATITEATVDGFITGVDWSSITFSNGSATKTWSSGTPFDPNGGNGGNNSGEVLPYKVSGDTLTFNPWGRGDGTRVFTPDDPDCNKWDLKPGTGGAFPVGEWLNQNNYENSNGKRYERFIFNSDGTWKRYSDSEYNFSYTLSGNSVSGTITDYGSIDYKVSGNTLTFNPWRQGDGTRVFTPDDPECDKWDLIPGTEGTFPEGKWADQSNNSYWTNYVEFTSTNMKRISSTVLTGTYEVSGNTFVLRTTW